MSRRGEWARGFLWSDWCFLVVAAAGLLVFVFLLPQLLSGGWRLRQQAEVPLKFDDLLTNLPPAVHIRLNAVLGRQAHNYTPDDLNEAASASGVALWRLSTGLILVVVAVGLVISALVIWQSLRSDGAWKRFGIILLINAVAAVALWSWLFGCGKVWPSTAMARQFLGSVQRGLDDGVPKGERCLKLEAWGCSALIDWELYVTYFGYLMAVCLLCASGAVLLPGGGEALEEAERIAAQMRRLRLILYVGAAALVLTTLRARMSFSWALEYLPPLSLLEKDAGETLAAAVLYRRLESLVTNVVTSVAVLNTLVLAAVYVPSALVLRRRAEVVTPEAMKEEAGRGWRKPVGRGEWMQARGLVFPLKDHLGRVAAILSPLLAGPVAELLSLLKS